MFAHRSILAYCIPSQPSWRILIPPIQILLVVRLHLQSIRRRCLGAHVIWPYIQVRPFLEQEITSGVCRRLSGIEERIVER